MHAAFRRFIARMPSCSSFRQQKSQCMGWVAVRSLLPGVAGRVPTWWEKRVGVRRLNMRKSPRPRKAGGERQEGSRRDATNHHAELHDLVSATRGWDGSAARTMGAGGRNKVGGGH